jgi:hypothetical protein
MRVITIEVYDHTPMEEVRDIINCIVALGVPANKVAFMDEPELRDPWLDSEEACEIEAW